MAFTTSRTCSRLAILALGVATALSGCGDEASGDDGVKSSNEDTGGGGNIDGSITDDAGSTTDTGSGTTDTGSGTTDTGSTDAGDQDTGSTDTGSPDAGPADTGSDDCPGGPGCDCKQNDQCDAGVCLDTHEGKKCAKKCTDTCPQGYACKNISSSGDALFFCVSTQVTICAPCKEHKDCVVNGVDSLCLDYGEDGKFCGAPCKTDKECPSDYTCADAKDANGKTVKQCKTKFTTSGGSGKTCKTDAECDAKTGESCVAGKCAIGKNKTCGCSDWAKSKGAETNCAISNEYGTCKATRKCTQAGLGKCEAEAPKSEVCNGIDDDCNGTKDDLPKTFKCSKKAFEDKGSKTACKTDADCTTKGEACDEKDSKCKILIGACPGKPTCSSAGELICGDAKIPTIEQCNLQDDDCDGTTDEGFLWKDPISGKDLAVNTDCGGNGPCKGGKVVCDSFTKATCNSYDKAKPEKGACDGVDTDCNGKVDDNACDDGDECTVDKCDSKASKCSNTPGADCDDKNQCTKDSCDTKTGKCVNAPTDGVSCDDQNACTSGDTCGKHPKTGKLTCIGGAPVKCDDNNICTDEKCDTQKGCVKLPNAATETCYSGDKGTEGKGVCKAGYKQCKDGKLDPKCIGEVPNAKKEACDGKDDTCDGKTDEGCKPTDVAVTFSSAYVAGKSGTGAKAVNVQMLVGPSGPVGKATGKKHEVEFGFLAWLMALLK